MNAKGVEPGPDAGSPTGGGGPQEQGLADEAPLGETAGQLRSHRRGMLAGLGVVGLLLAVLLLFGSGGSGPKIPAQGEHGRAPLTIPVQKPTASVASTTSTSSPPAPVPPAIKSGRGVVTDPAASAAPVTVASSLPAPKATAPPAPVSSTTTTTAPAPTTTTTSVPPATTTTTSCFLIFCG
ncbi:MAG TPA: hypothetical protein VH012_08030 [Acidimicrobiales bacterium]|jgi:hypothetical protein|nr:hypothetical protein [Acidimicrobiales bacterium]